MLRRAQEGSQTFLTAIILMVASERRMAAGWFTRVLMEGFAQRRKSKDSLANFANSVPAGATPHQLSRRSVLPPHSFAKAVSFQPRASNAAVRFG